MSDLTSLRISLPADYDTSLGYPLNADGTLNPASLTNFNGQPFYLNGSGKLASMAFRVEWSRINTHLATESWLCLQSHGRWKDGNQRRLWNVL